MFLHYFNIIMLTIIILLKVTHKKVTKNSINVSFLDESRQFHQWSNNSIVLVQYSQYSVLFFVHKTFYELKI